MTVGLMIGFLLLAPIEALVVSNARRQINARVFYENCLNWSTSFQMLKQGIVGAVFTTWILSTALSHQGPAKVDFRRDVHPLLKQFCIECHGPSQQMHGFRLDRRRDARRYGYYDFAITASALRSLQVYGVKAQQAKYGIAVKRAADWLMKAPPQTTDDRVFQLPGLAWAGIKPESQIIKKRVRDLIAEQRANGGWAQIPGLASDAYATGQALAALRLAGEIKANDPALPARRRVSIEDANR